MATVAIFALLAAVALPNLRIARDRATREEARRLAADLELLRSRALATGVPHRIVFDLDASRWQLESWRSPTPPPGVDPPAPPEVFLPEPDDPLYLSPPRGLEADFRILPGSRASLLPEEVRLAHVVSDGTELRQGEVSLRFERDGSAEPVVIQLVDESGSAFEVAVEPFSDLIRVERAQAD